MLHSIRETRETMAAYYLWKTFNVEVIPWPSIEEREKYEKKTGLVGIPILIFLEDDLADEGTIGNRLTKNEIIRNRLRREGRMSITFYRPPSEDFTAYDVVWVSAGTVSFNSNPTYNISYSKCGSCKKKLYWGKKERKICSGCCVASYCSEECQNADWKPQHKRECPTLEFDYLKKATRNKNLPKCLEIETGDTFISVPMIKSKGSFTKLYFDEE